MNSPSYVRLMQKKKKWKKVFCRTKKKNPWKYVSCLKIFSIQSHYVGEEGEKPVNFPSAFSLHLPYFPLPTANLSSNPVSPSLRTSSTSGLQPLPQCSESPPHGLLQQSPDCPLCLHFPLLVNALRLKQRSPPHKATYVFFTDLHRHRLPTGI